MQRINTDDGFFVAGNPATGLLGTPLTKQWLDSFQEEIVSVLTLAGHTLDPARMDQLAEAIVDLIEARTLLLASSSETIAGTSNSRAVSPAGLSARTALTTRTGLVQLATTDDLKTGTSAFRVPAVATIMGLFSNTGTVMKLPKGIVLQTGISGAIAEDAPVTLSFPEAFSSAPVVVPFIQNAVNANDDVFPRIVGVSASQVQLRSERTSDGLFTGTRYIGYLALGTIIG